MAFKPVPAGQPFLFFPSMACLFWVDADVKEEQGQLLTFLFKKVFSLFRWGKGLGGEQGSDT